MTNFELKVFVLQIVAVALGVVLGQTILSIR